MTAEELIRAGRLEEALAALQQEIRSKPGDAKLRIFLFQLLSVLGKWEKALTQLNVLRDLDADGVLLSQIFTSALQCEMLRAEVFAGRRSPLIFGEPMEWIGLMVQANQLLAKGQVDAAVESRNQAFDAAPQTAGKINEHSFEWIADADSRLGPLLEIMLDGKYYWAPFSRIKSLAIEPPGDLRNLVWAPAHFVWTNGGEASGLIPTRYPGSETAGDSGFSLARKTEWREQAGETYIGLGQRLLATDEGEYPLLDIKRIEFSIAPAPESA
jgi:type VI secretion system protein ImpE